MNQRKGPRPGRVLGGIGAFFKNYSFKPALCLVRPEKYRFVAGNGKTGHEAGRPACGATSSGTASSATSCFTEYQGRNGKGDSRG